MTTTTDRQHADVGGRNRSDGAPPMPPITWDHERHPYPDEWINYFLTLSTRQKEWLVGNLLGHAQTGVHCLMQMHTELLGTDTLSRAQIKVQAHLDDTDGITCPCCGQLAKRYRRKITSQIARALIAMHRHVHNYRSLLDVERFPEDQYHSHLIRHDGSLYVHLPTLLGKTADEAKAAYWQLIEPLSAVRDDGSYRTGWWTLTALGEEYVRGERRLVKYANVFDGCCQGFEGPMVDIRDALGTRFSYDDLMAGV